MQRLVNTRIYHMNAVYREGLKNILSGTRYRVLKDAPHASSLPVKFNALHPRVHLFMLGTELDGPDLNATVRACKTCHVNCRIIILSGRSDKQEAILAVRAGADAYIDMPKSAEALIKSLDLIMAGQKILAPSVLNSLFADAI